MILLDGGIQITGSMISAAIVTLIVVVIGFLIRRSIMARDKKIESQDKRIKSLEESHSDQRVVNKGNEDFQIAAKASDEKSQEVYKEIFTKLDSIKTFVSDKVDGIKLTFDEKFETLTKSFHQLELRMPPPKKNNNP